jgi:hypothetical protein
MLFETHLSASYDAHRDHGIRAVTGAAAMRGNGAIDVPALAHTIVAPSSQRHDAGRTGIAKPYQLRATSPDCNANAARERSL